MTDKDFDKIYTVFFQKRNQAICSGKTDLQLLGFVLEELKIIDVKDYPNLLNKIVIRFSKSKLPTKAFSRYNRLSIDNLILKSNLVSPLELDIRIKPLNKTFDEVVKSLSRIVAKDLYRPVMEGVFLNSKENELAATDANILMTIPRKLSIKSIIVNPKTNLKNIDKSVPLFKNRYKAISGEFPKYKNVIPKYNNTSRIFELIPFLNQVKALEKLSSFFIDKEQFVIKLIGQEQTIYLKPVLLVKLLIAMKEQDVFQFRFTWADKEARGKSVLIKCLQNKGIKSLIMPYLIESDDNDYAFIEYDLFDKTPIKKVNSRKRKGSSIKVKNRKGASKKSLSLKAKAIKLKLQLLKL